MTNDRHELSILLESCSDILFKKLDINLADYVLTDTQIRGACPCHNGDNRSGFSYYVNDGAWACWTKKCHKEKGNDLIALIALIKEVNINEACRFAVKLLKSQNISLDNITQRIKARTQKRKERDHWKEHIEQKSFNEKVLKKMKPAYEYAEMRGLSSRVFKRMDAGYATTGKMKFRVVFPIRNIEGKIIAFTGRTVSNQDPRKWIHLPPAPRFRSSINLLNLHRAASHIRRTGYALIVEGPFDVVKLEMAGYKNAVAVLGLSVTNGHIQILKRIGAIHTVLGFDPDKFDSSEVRDNIRKLQDSNFNVHVLKWEGEEDIGDMDMQKLDCVIKDHVPNIRKD